MDKYCKKCQNLKGCDEFFKQKAAKDGFFNCCKSCYKIYQKEYCQVNKEEIQEKSQKYYRRTFKERKKEIYARNKKWRENNKEKSNEINRKWAKNNPKKRQQITQRNYQKYRKQKIETAIKYTKEKRKNNPYFRMVQSLRSRLQHCVTKSKNNKFNNLIGCNRIELLNYIESLFQPGMSWDNYGWGTGKWVIDHIYPVSKFDLTKLENQFECFNYKNLRPLWFEENKEKSDKTPEEWESYKKSKTKHLPEMRNNENSASNLHSQPNQIRADNTSSQEIPKI